MDTGHHNVDTVASGVCDLKVPLGTGPAIFQPPPPTNPPTHKDMRMVLLFLPFLSGRPRSAVYPAPLVCCEKIAQSRVHDPWYLVQGC